MSAARSAPQQSGRVDGLPSEPLSQTGSSEASTSSAGANVQSYSLWKQWKTGTGWFGPLVPLDTDEEVAERKRKADEQRAKEKMQSVHKWRPSSDDDSTREPPPPSRPTLRQRLSSAVEMKWWPSNAAAPNRSRANTVEQQVEEEDMQQPHATSAHAPRENDWVSTESPADLTLAEVHASKGKSTGS